MEKMKTKILIILIILIMLGVGGFFVLRGICKKVFWSPNCNFISEPESRKVCEICKKLIGTEQKGIIKEEDITQITSFTGRSFGTYDSDWNPDGTQIVFGRAGDIGDEQGLYIINSDGTGLTKIGDDVLYDPSWSPVDNRILCTGWVGDSNGFNELFIIDLDKDKTKKDSLGAEYANYPAWSPDGKKIVYEVYDDSNSPLPLYDPLCNGTGVLASIWVMNSDGTGKKQLTTEEDGYCSDASFSPDGSKIVYKKGFVNSGAPFLVKEPPNEIWVMNSDGSDKHMIHTTGDSKYFLHQRAWSKNNEIIFEKLQWQKPPEIWIMNSDGTNPRCLIKPEESPDGKLLIYHDIAWDNTGTKITLSRHEVYEGKMPDISHDIDSTSSHFKDSNLVTFPWEE
jgi:Tol biopolymer transport system component